MRLSLAALLDSGVGRVENTTRLDPIADRAAALALGPLKAARVRTMLSGTAAGHPLHPALISVPIGSWLAALFLDATGGAPNDVAARRLIGLGLVAAGPAVLTGASDWAYTTGAERRVGFVHAMTNYLGIGLFGGSWLARRHGHRSTGIAMSAAGATAIGIAGWLGGHLSYARGVGVDTTAFQVAPQDWTDVLQDDELPEETPTLAHAAGIPILLVRHEGRLLAMADRCTHRGAPLHDGQLVDGRLVCPWHASRFCLEDGRVLTGPAVRPQPVYETRTRYGTIQVRRTYEPGSLRSNPVS